MQLNKANSFDTEASLMDLNTSLSNGTFSTKIYYKRDNFDFDNVYFPVFDCDILSEHFMEYSSVADPERVRGVQTNPLLSLNYFIFMGNFRKNWSNSTNRTPLS